MLLDILKYKRPAGSKSEEEMIRKFIDILPDCYSDGFGNRIVRVGTNNSTMFSCHTDTVHSKDGKQKVIYDSTLGEVFVEGDVLGADDAAGIIIMINMIKAGINGLYVFHREEELGGRGSNYIQRDTPELLDGIVRCIAFDRRGQDSVITHQGSEQCCSDEFAEDLCQALMSTGMTWFPDNTGLFTDSANYTHIIPECTNVSCGYDNEHTSKETLNVKFLDKLIKVILTIDWDSLSTVRDPNIQSYYDYSIDTLPSLSSLKTYEDLLDFVYDYPEDAAYMLQEYQQYIEDEADLLSDYNRRYSI